MLSAANPRLPLKRYKTKHINQLFYIDILYLSFQNTCDGYPEGY